MTSSAAQSWRLGSLRELEKRQDSKNCNRGEIVCLGQIFRLPSLFAFLTKQNIMGK